MLVIPFSKGGQLSILDNEKMILESIPEKMIKVLYNFPRQFKAAENIIRREKLSFNKKFKNAIILGVGSSSNVVYRLINSIEIDRVNIPIFLCSRSTMPSWVNKDTLVVAVTHSGNSIEVLEAVDKALKLGTDVVAITTGGKLKKIASNNKDIRLIEYESDTISRMVVGYIYVFVLNILNKAGAVDICSDRKERLLGIDWNEVENALSGLSRELSPDVRTNKNIAKRTAVNLFGNIPIIYGSSMLTGTVGYRLKSQICLNSNNFAHLNTIPELDHDEIAAWGMKHELRNKFFVLFITDKDSREETLRRVEILKGILLEKRINFEEIILEGLNDAIKGFSGIFLADWISVYLAVLNNVDPTSSTLLDLMKTRFERVSSSEKRPNILDNIK
jgi:glucose/mannose-6-phosphate isomerase